MLGLCWAHVGPRTAIMWACVQPFFQCRFKKNWVWIKKLPPFLGHVGAMPGVCGTYVGPMLDHVGLLEAMSGLCWAYVEPMSGQERRSCGLMFSPFQPRPIRKIRCGLKTPSFLGHVGVMLGLCGTMLGSWGLCWGYAEFMLSPCWAKNRVFILALASGLRWTRRFWVMLKPCCAYVGVYVGTYLWVLASFTICLSLLMWDFRLLIKL